MKSTWIFRPPIPPVALMYLPAACVPSTMPWSTPGTIGLSTSVTTAIRIVVGLTPTSVALFEFAAFSTPPPRDGRPDGQRHREQRDERDVPHLPLRHVYPPGRK